MPKSKGGKDHISNLQTMCFECKEMHGVNINSCLNEAKQLNEAKAKLVTTWVEGNSVPDKYGILNGTTGENTIELRIQLSFKSKWFFVGDIKNAEGKSVAGVYLNEMKSYKTFQNKWKSNFGKLMQAPDEALLRKVMDDVHSANASNFFYVS